MRPYGDRGAGHGGCRIRGPRTTRVADYPIHMKHLPSEGGFLPFGGSGFYLSAAGPYAR